MNSKSRNYKMKIIQKTLNYFEEKPSFIFLNGELSMRTTKRGFNTSTFINQ